MSDLIDALRTVADYAKAAGQMKVNHTVTLWCQTQADLVVNERAKHIQIAKQLARAEFPGLNFDAWTDDHFAELGELCRREVQQQFASGDVAESAVNPDV